MIRSYLALIAFCIGVPSILSFSSVTPQLRTLSSQRPSRAPFSSPTTTTTTRQYQTTTQKIATCLAASNKGNSGLETLRARLRDVTGFSFTAMRATLRASTGISLTAISASARATTSIVVTKMMKWFLDMFPTWVSRGGRHMYLYILPHFGWPLEEPFLIDTCYFPNLLLVFLLLVTILCPAIPCLVLLAPSSTT